MVDLYRIQEEAWTSRMSFSVSLAGEIYYLITFQNVDSMNMILNIGTFYSPIDLYKYLIGTHRTLPVAPRFRSVSKVSRYPFGVSSSLPLLVMN